MRHPIGIVLAIAAIFVNAGCAHPTPTPETDIKSAPEANIYRNFPPPQTISESAQLYLSKPLEVDRVLYVPQSPEEWRKFQNEYSEKMGALLPVFAARAGLEVTKEAISNIPVYYVTPNELSAEKAGKVILVTHGGGYLLGGGKASFAEAIVISHGTGYASVSVDYRMPPEHPFPAAIEDATRVYESLLETYAPSDIAIFGGSAGGGLAAATILNIRNKGLPTPAAAVLNTPWSDLNKIGDSYSTLEGLDPLLVTYDGQLEAMAELYAGGEDMKNPLLSPVYADFSSGFPPSLLVTGTRDLFLSNTVRLHRALRDAGAQSDLLVYEGMWHGFSLLPENESLNREYKRFLDEHLLAE